MSHDYHIGVDYGQEGMLDETQIAYIASKLDKKIVILKTKQLGIERMKNIIEYYNKKYETIQPPTGIIRP